MKYELAIIGGGPAAAAAAVYAGRKQLSTVVIAEEVGGQSAVSETIYNWIGTPAISGTDLAKAFKTHIEEYSPEKAAEKGTVSLLIGSRVEKIIKSDDGTFHISLANGTTVESRAVLIGTGSRHRKLEAQGADRLDHKGIMYCATCDGPLFSNLPVAVIGGGNAAFEAALQLSQYTSSVTLIHRSDTFKADPITVDRVKKDPNISIVTNATLTQVDGENFVERLTYQVADAPETTDLNVSGIFVEIGQIPNTEPVEGLVTLDELKRVVVDPYSQRTSVTGLWAAGDCTNGRYHQNNIAAGDAVKALEDIYIWLKTGK